MHKINIFDSMEPWVTWGNQFIQYKPELITHHNPKAYVIEVSGDFQTGNAIKLAKEVIDPDKYPTIFLYAENHYDIDQVIDFKNFYNGKVFVLSEDDLMLGLCKKHDIPHTFWAKPTRVPEKLLLKNNMDFPHKKTEDFMIMVNAKKDEEGLVEAIRTYFSMCMYETKEGDILGGNKLNVFSAQDLPVEPFNNVIFHGLQPNPIMFKELARSKLFISPCSGPPSINIIDAIMIGTPVLIKDTDHNREFFGLTDTAYYRDEESLARAIKEYRFLTPGNIHSIAVENMIRFKRWENITIEGSFNRLMEIINKIGV
jgi:hypothetical protein